MQSLIVDNVAARFYTRLGYREQEVRRKLLLGRGGANPMGRNGYRKPEHLIRPKNNNMWYQGITRWHYLQAFEGQIFSLFSNVFGVFDIFDG